MIVYKIRYKLIPDTYLSGTPSYHKYDSNGRIFAKLGHLRSFITSVLKMPYRACDIEQWEIVEFELNVRHIKQIHEVVKPEKIVEMLKA
jgi:hypothetical protein